jgi:lysozyme
MNLDRLYALLILHEGEKLIAYKCPAGKWTIGVGHNLEANPIEGLGPGSEITHERAVEILARDVDACFAALRKHLAWFEDLCEARRAVLVDMCFNLGTWGLLGFKNTLQMIQGDKYDKAAAAMLQSKWATQVGQRANRLSRMMQTGEWSI